VPPTWQVTSSLYDLPLAMWVALLKIILLILLFH
jgi:hypothetical protein